MLDKRLANQYGDVISICRALKPHATNLCFMTDSGLTLLQPVIGSILNWVKLNTSEVDIGPFIHTYMNIAEATSVNAKFRKTKSEIDWVLEDRTRMLHIRNPDGTELKSPVFALNETREALYNKVYKRVLEEKERFVHMPFEEFPDSWFEPISMDIVEPMLKKFQVQIEVGGHAILISRPLFGDLKKTEWLGGKILAVRDRTEDDPTCKAWVYFKQREPLMDIYTYGAFLILEED